MALQAKTSAGKILHNSFWYGLETLLETVVFFGTSIAVARALGPAKLGYFSYINFFVLLVNRTSGSGLAGATRKYMSEYLGLGKPGVARAVYFFAYRYQLLGAVLITALGLAAIALFGEHGYRLMASILILSIIPGVMSWVPAQANNALEDVSQNTVSAFGYILSYTAIVLLTLHFHWDLVGIASATLIGRTLEALMRTAPLHARLRQLSPEPLPGETATAIRRFCLQAIGIQILVSVVWDRSEMIFLRHFSTLEQLGFYSVSFGFANNLLLVPRTFAGATGITLMVEAARDPTRVRGIIDNASRYLLLVAIPVHVGAAAITAQAIHYTYGNKYDGAVPVLIVASILSLPRAFFEIPDTLMRAADRQKRLLLWMGVIGVVNLALDALLIPRYGAVGAAWGNGLAQSFGVFVLWKQSRRYYDFSLPMGAALRLGVAGTLMAAAAYAIGRAVPHLPGLILAVATAAPLYILLVKLVHGLNPSDRQRLEPLGNRLPPAFRRFFTATVAFVTPAN